MSTSDDAVLDPAIVGQLQELARAGNPELLHRLQASFSRDAPLRLKALREAVEAGDTEAVAFNVHALKGSAANLGAHGVVATCREIEAVLAGQLEPLVTELEQRTLQAQMALARLAEAG